MSYLSPRSFRVKCDNNLSSFHTSACGVSQGSVLGPSNASSSLWPKKFSLLPNLHTFITSSPSNVLVVLDLHPSLLLLGHLHNPLLKLLIDPFGMFHHVYGINSLYPFVNLILVPVPPFPTHPFLHPSLLRLLIHHSAHPSLFRLRFKTYLFHKSHPRLVLLFLPGLHSRTFARTVSSELIGFCF